MWWPEPSAIAPLKWKRTTLAAAHKLFGADGCPRHKPGSPVWIAEIDPYSEDNAYWIYEGDPGEAGDLSGFPTYGKRFVVWIRTAKDGKTWHEGARTLSAAKKCAESYR
jgi:hypothetical protein